VPRIVSGAARGRTLQVPATGTRPTSDRAREALFSSLASLLDLSGARVLDLFAGTGAIGLEALSRGAAHVTLVESGRDAASVLQRNVDAVALPGAVIARMSVESYLAGGDQSGPPFDLVYADPPYAFTDAAATALLDTLAAGNRWLGEDAIVVIERSARGAPLTWPDVFEAIKDRRYGEGVLWYGRPQPAQQSVTNPPASGHRGNR
jgi:16S rRNA (guanine966-N2)-methyltransferase